MEALQRWRKQKKLTQVEAASVLGISQTYLSLLEKGTRPLTPELKSRMNAWPNTTPQSIEDGVFRAKLSALGYPGFAHVARSRTKSSPAALLIAILSAPDADARVIEAVPWLIKHHALHKDFSWLVRQAKLRNLQNRLGFVLQLSGANTPEAISAVRELERARLLDEATLCWDSMPGATRDWMRNNRTPLAASWNILTRLEPDEAQNAA